MMWQPNEDMMSYAEWSMIPKPLKDQIIRNLQAFNDEENRLVYQRMIGAPTDRIIDDHEFQYWQRFGAIPATNIDTLIREIQEEG